MDVIGWAFGFVAGYVIPFLIVLTIVVFFHELGHYLVGRWCGIHAEIFSVGFGREIAGFTDRRGTRWRLSLIPLGGYVKFLGDDNAASMPDAGAGRSLPASLRRHSFEAAALWRRAATVAAGPIANFILAVVIFAAMFYANGRVIADPIVARVTDNSAAAVAGIEPGDLFMAIDGRPMATFDDVRRYVSPRPGVEIVVTVERDGERLDIPVVPQRQVIEDRFGNALEVGLIGVVTDQSAGNFRVQEFGPFEAVAAGVGESWYIVARTMGYIGNIITGREKPDQLGGPIRVAQVSGQMATLGFAALIQLAAVLSVSIGLLNLMPVPMLDGGHLVFYAIEAVRGRPIGDHAKELAFRFGLGMVLMLMLFATWNDVNRLFG